LIISEMQSKLATWSTENKERKFDRLLRLVTNRSWLSEAAGITLASSGARTPGVDGISKRKMEENLILSWKRYGTNYSLELTVHYPPVAYTSQKRMANSDR
jgi:retron-type reverse transcriptase